MQTAYPLKQAVAVAGLLFDLAENLVESAAAEGPVAFGFAVVKGTLDNGIAGSAQVKVPSADGQLFRGVAVRDLSQPMLPENLTVGYAPTSTVGHLRRGRIWVPVNDAVALDAPAFFVHTGVGAGMFADGAAGVTAGTPTANAGNAGNGVLGAVTVNPALAIVGVYTLDIEDDGPTAAFSVRDPLGELVGAGAVGTLFNAGGLSFTLADGANDFEAGDGFTIAVTEVFDADAVPTGVFRSSTTGAGLAVLEINLP